MAPATGHAGTDHLRSRALADAGCAVAAEILGAGGSFVAKSGKVGRKAICWRG
jgi:23S rRNA U2552 (ribose-2'-O)-methylase RlmE/FtsJ